MRLAVRGRKSAVREQGRTAPLKLIALGRQIFDAMVERNCAADFVANGRGAVEADVVRTSGPGARHRLAECPPLRLRGSHTPSGNLWRKDDAALRAGLGA